MLDIRPAMFASLLTKVQHASSEQPAAKRARRDDAAAAAPSPPSAGITLRQDFFRQHETLLAGHVSDLLRAALWPAVAEAEPTPKWIDGELPRVQQVVFVRVKGVDPQVLAREQHRAPDSAVAAAAPSTAATAPVCLPFIRSMAAAKTMLREPRFGPATQLLDAADLILSPFRRTALAPADFPFAARRAHELLFDVSHPHWHGLLLLALPEAPELGAAALRQQGECVRGSGVRGTWVLELPRGHPCGDSSAEEGELSEDDGAVAGDSDPWSAVRELRLTLHWGGRFPAETVHSTDGGRSFEAQGTSGAVRLDLVDTLQPTLACAPASPCRDTASASVATLEVVRAPVVDDASSILRTPLLGAAETLRGALAFLLTDAELVDLR